MNRHADLANTTTNTAVRTAVDTSVRPEPDDSQPLLTVRDLSVRFRTYGGHVHALRQVCLHVARGETLAIVGESGSGKSVTSQAIMGLLPARTAQITEGSITFDGRELTTLKPTQWREIQGRRIALIFQDPMTALNPTLTIGEQLTEGVRRHLKYTAKQAQDRAIQMLELVGISSPHERLRQFPHEFSGGMRQRIVIAIALMCEPDLLIADEPTTALDVTIQAQILTLFRDIQKRTGVAIILITHDLGVVAGIADRVTVMYAGQCVETANVHALFARPAHPYTRALLASVPRLDMPAASLKAIAGQPPDLFAPPAGCAFAARCGHAMRVCCQVAPPQTTLPGQAWVHCWLHDARAPVKQR
ncbi:peptide ABC transporter ATP-binding protein [Advenella sp. S44]|uniref:ABC transporter ATP-binding protein n=1 Tax=Advenella sp. S44 TaxID=1982755 RepID=UPI000C2B08D8|nr:ABC transporter ATP-binding protein [Advenella sp. S44]PJX28221.1 peptide ABC transporter ATP-binding protein [Advenella sp. S44]